MEQGREERSLTEFGDREVELFCRGREGFGAGAVTAGDAVFGAFVGSGADLGGGLGVDQVLQAGLEESPEQFFVCEGGIGEEFLLQARQGRLVVGHRGVLHMVLGGIRSHDDSPQSLQHPGRVATGMPPRYGTHPSLQCTLTERLQRQRLLLCWRAACLAMVLHAASLRRSL